MAVIEFALLIMTMILIVFGAVSFGLAIRNLQILSDANMAAAAWGANSTFHSTLFGGAAAAGWSGPQSIEAVVTNAMAGLGNTVVTANNYCTCSPGGSPVACSSTCTTSSGADQPMCYVKVVTTTTFASVFHLPGMPASFTFTNTSVMPIY